MLNNVFYAMRDTIKLPLPGVCFMVALAGLLLPAAAHGAFNHEQTTSAGMFSVAAAENNPAEYATGDIVIVVKDENSQPVTGATVRLVLPGADGSLVKLPNILFEAVDGGSDDADGTVNGQVVFKADAISPYIADGADFLISVEKAGYVRSSGERRSYSSEEAGIVEIVLKTPKSTRQVK